ncbi:hypothetical protein SJ_250 [Proteus phage SJ_PmiM]|nr:hypothetical protein SJ_250 [Proteus phage SJ_PmiM]
MSKHIVNILGIKNWDTVTEWDYFLDVVFLYAELKEDNLFCLPHDIEYEYIWINMATSKIEVQGPDKFHEFNINLSLGLIE